MSKSKKQLPRQLAAEVEPIRRYLIDIDKLQARIKELEALLLYAEWRGPCDYSMGTSSCPWCGRYAKSEQYGTDGKHAIDCKLKQALEDQTMDCEHNDEIDNLRMERNRLREENNRAC